VILNHFGKQLEVTVDDYFPCLNGKPAFSRANGFELWVLILEKAYAKVFRSYERIEGGLAEEALRDLTGAPYESLDSVSEEFWAKVIESEEKGYLMVASAGKESQEQLASIGLVPGHAYSVLDAKEINVTASKTEKILKLRNPWGKFEWTGDWSDKSPLWTPSTIKQVAG
jgi:calpain-15